MTSITIYFLIGTLQFGSPAVTIPLSGSFGHRFDCLRQLDEQILAVRRKSRGPVSLTISSYCEPRQVEVPEELL